MFGYLKEKVVFFYKASYVIANFYLGKSFYQPQIKSSFIPISTIKNDSVIPHVYMCCK